MELVVKVIGKAVEKDGQKFTAYTFLTAELNWYKVSGIDPKDLKKYEDKVVNATILRKFDRHYVKKDGTKGTNAVLVVENVKDATPEQIREYDKRQRELYAETLDGIN